LFKEPLFAFGDPLFEAHLSVAHKHCLDINGSLCMSFTLQLYVVVFLLESVISADGKVPDWKTTSKLSNGFPDPFLPLISGYKDRNI
jgi:hypothetical protein